MKIYFSAALAQKKEYGWAYMEIIEALEKQGHEVLQKIVDVSFEEVYYSSMEYRRSYYQQVLKWMAEADLVVLEVSFPSTLHIGHELSLSLEKGKPVVALYYQDRVPAFFTGMQSDKVFWEEYTEGQIDMILRHVLPEASDQRNYRYNFHASPKQVGFLDEMAKKQNITRAVAMRRLIENDLASHPDFGTGGPKPF